MEGEQRKNGQSELATPAPGLGEQAVHPFEAVIEDHSLDAPPAVSRFPASSHSPSEAPTAPETFDPCAAPETLPIALNDCRRAAVDSFLFSAVGREQETKIPKPPALIGISGLQPTSPSTAARSKGYYSANTR